MCPDLTRKVVHECATDAGPPPFNRRTEAPPSHETWNGCYPVCPSQIELLHRSSIQERVTVLAKAPRRYKWLNCRASERDINAQVV